MYLCLHVQVNIDEAYQNFLEGGVVVDGFIVGAAGLSQVMVAVRLRQRKGLCNNTHTECHTKLSEDAVMLSLYKKSTLNRLQISSRCVSLTSQTRTSSMIYSSCIVPNSSGIFVAVL